MPTRAYTYFDKPGIGLCVLCAQTLHIPGRNPQTTWVLLQAERFSWGIDILMPHKVYPLNYVGTRRQVADSLYQDGASPAEDRPAKEAA